MMRMRMNEWMHTYRLEHKHLRRSFDIQEDRRRPLNQQQTEMKMVQYQRGKSRLAIIFWVAIYRSSFRPNDQNS